jgi:peptide/nickel transport system substrate-binding protein
MKKFHLFILALMVISMGLSLPEGAVAQTSKETIHVVVTADADTYDPHCWTTDDGKTVGFHIFEALVTRRSEPKLATSWENPDNLTWIFHLKKNIRFSNGELFDASVVKFNLERYMDPKTKALFAGLLEPVESVDVVDQYTLKIKTKTPYPVLLTVFRDIYMMSPKAVKEYGKDIPKKPIGTGPYVLKEWIPMERSVIEANPAYYGPKPKVKTIVWRPIPEPSTRIVELRTGKADIITKVPPELVGEISGKGLQVVRGRSNMRMTVKLNCGKPPFDNVKVRQAFNYAVNKEDLIKYVLNGAGYLMTCPLGPDRDGFNPTLKPYPHDPATAKKLLAEAGYPNGLDIEIVAPAGRYLKDKELVEAISFQVKEAGFNMKVNAMEWGRFLKNFKESQGFFIGADHPYAQRILHVDGDSRGKAFSWMGYHNDEFMKLFDEAGTTFDIKKRNAIYQKMAKVIWDDAIHLYLYYAQHAYGVNERLKDYKIEPEGFILLENAYLQ